MNWFEKLNQYFPIEEMKSQEHMEALLDEKGDVYHKDEGEKHVLMYAEFPTFVFIDYVYVSATARGEGLGHKLMQKMKEKNKPIILEVEPVDYEDSDTEKRLRFYQREGFTHAHSIGYSRRSLATDEWSHLEILYWSPEDSSEQEIFDQMKHMYEEIHTYKDKTFYGKSYQPVEEVLKIDEKKSSSNMMEELNNKEKA
ncbi:GNAT family N-acetyltransferase [Salimicrobium flavidum]|uniref:Acetyltransferase (GNAT) domain-containing protein n=1 Tax=Salimicrobium flavidum TaxID=570947 RepID=A0A1N7JER0_9BACI|nr:GNAT family N-acetyltransferase [Salimicrobium flavidum]SIS47799.1 Acetyltransferase (GNAT) domain-containing protein [Salimicrobium flavidum]